MIINILRKKNYILRDTLVKRELRKFALRVFRAVKDFNVNKITSQLTFIYININLDL